MGSLTVRLTARDVLYLKRTTTASGGLQRLIRRLQDGMRVVRGKHEQYRGQRVAAHSLTLTTDDLKSIPAYWKKTGGKPGSGGYQSRLPIESLRRAGLLPSVAPMFEELAVVVRAESYVYFKRQAIGGDGRIKIGRGGRKRARQSRSTDNPNRLVTLLVMPETDGRNEGYYHRRFARFRCRPDQEWFWPDDELVAFIEDQIREQDAQREKSA